MEPEVKKEQEQPHEQSHLAHTYQDDLARAMNATDAPIVQELLADARDRELLAAEEIVERREEKWYSITALLLIILTIVVIGAGTYYYLHLTVPVHPSVSVGVFQSTDNIVASATTIDQVITNLTTPLNTTTQPVLQIGKPTLINLVTDAKTNALLLDTQLFSFMQATVPEPLQSAISAARLGVVNTGTEVVPFIILSVPNPQKASQEFTNTEPALLQMFYKPLAINLAAYQSAPASTLSFQSQYFFNLPVRTLVDARASAPQNVVFLYGYASNNIIVITTKPQVLKYIYDTIVSQS